MKDKQIVVVLDFGGQYKDLIARRVRELGVYSIILSGDTTTDEILSYNPIGIITTGGPKSVYKPNSPLCEKELLESGIPVLGICYGMQMMAYILGGKVSSASVSEYGQTKAKVIHESKLFANTDSELKVLMSHTDRIITLPEGFVATVKTENCPIAAMENNDKRLYGVQFHPEVTHTIKGKKIIRNFLYNICNAKGDYNMKNYIETAVEEIRKQVGNEQVLLGLSGGVDSAVCAALISKAIPNQLVCIFVDHGFMRMNEAEEVKQAFADKSLKLIAVDASERFLKKLEGVTDPEKKRKIIGAEFVEVFNDEALKLGRIKFLAQGTIYPDVIESGNGKAATIKSHHNVGGLPEKMGFSGLVEPLRGLFKDEVRKVGRELGLPTAITERQPFPGPGLAIRIIGEITKEKLDMLREADYIYREEIGKMKKKPSQYFAVLTNTKTVGVMGDERTYGYVLALRAVVTGDFMTADYAHIPQSILAKISKRITNEVHGITRIVYDITGKPPATIEWE
ncbi:MAG TPA: glutamine-hydrolyzing GMP synthase [Clostridia bacterium]|nr:glutamine-hydrolyzing GMP synthase [Clostridia bacterium]HQM39329.1 glutamine-hydrolyzing GMP synthase [Clostridia bacterium]